ncbi:Protein quiver [Sergentomyia squamirostris]
MNFLAISTVFLCVLSFHRVLAIWCYRCTSATPGCGLYDFNWKGIGYLGEACPEDDDICMKVIERKGASETVIRDCFSSLRAYRTDIPADRYEGCRTAAHDVRLGHYVNNSIKQLDVHREHFDSTTFCFCFLDHRCNSSPYIGVSMTAIAASTIVGLWHLLSTW